MKAISTKYIGPTNYKGSRIKAYAEGGNSITLSYDDALNSDKNHLAAAVALRDKMNWKGGGKLLGGGTEKGYVFVFSNTWLKED
jgi:hypothetical protein